MQDFLGSVLATSKGRLRRLPKDQSLFRAQRGFTWRTEPLRTGEEEDEGTEVIDVETAHPRERMVPKADLVGAGRVNPRGIPVLYLATTLTAAVAEMRPWVGEHVSLARFNVVRDCTVVDCSLNTTGSWALEIVDLDTTVVPVEPAADAREVGIWGDIGCAFSTPVTCDESELEYIPTQILAETFRSAGYDGVVYKSLLDEKGKNIALFDVAAAKFTDCCLYRTKAASLELARRDDLLRWPESILSQLRRAKTFDCGPEKPRKGTTGV